jgi:hypothetical protein
MHPQVLTLSEARTRKPKFAVMRRYGHDDYVVETDFRTREHAERVAAQWQSAIPSRAYFVAEV